MFNREVVEIKHGFPVYLKIYHINILNYVLQIFGYGLYHSTIEINEREYFFFYTDEEYCGIMSESVDDTKMFSLKGKIYN